MLYKQDGLQAYMTNQIDEHDEPTEPVRRADVSASILSPVEEGVPSPKSSTQPFPRQYVQPPLIISQDPHYHPTANTPGGSAHQSPNPDMPDGQRPTGGVPSKTGSPPKPGQTTGRKLIPIAVGVCFVAVQMLLLLRFVLKFLQYSADSSWIGVVYEISSVFVLPFRLLLLQYSVPLFGTLEVYTLLAVLIYGVVSRIFVRGLKMVLKTR